MIRLLTRHGPDQRLSFKVFDEASAPPCAILSHMWHEDEEQEVAFRDFQNSRHILKTGWIKVISCIDQAKHDGLRYIWVDSCCIDRSSSSELSEAINSMFRWYSDADRCYAYLADVEHDTNWRESFKRSRWFTRGWTLQELLAPRAVHFFTMDWQAIGDKASLADTISQMTGICVRVLRCEASILDYSVDDRRAWATGRETKRLEDQVYCLLGILDVSMPVVYGEGEAKARQRLDDQLWRRSQSMYPEWDTLHSLMHDMTGIGDM